MSQESENLTPGSWAGWSTISPNNNPSFTIWLTGLPGTGKTTLALFLKKALVTRGYNVEIIDHQTFFRKKSMILYQQYHLIITQ